MYQKSKLHIAFWKNILKSEARIHVIFENQDF